MAGRRPVRAHHQALRCYPRQFSAGCSFAAPHHLLEPAPRPLRRLPQPPRENGLQLQPLRRLWTTAKQLLRLAGRTHGLRCRGAQREPAERQPRRTTDAAPPHLRHRPRLHARTEPHQHQRLPGAQPAAQQPHRLGRTRSGEEHLGRHEPNHLSRHRRQPAVRQSLEAARLVQHFAAHALIYRDVLPAARLSGRPAPEA